MNRSVLLIPLLVSLLYFKSCMIGGSFEGTYYLILDFDNAQFDCAEDYEGKDMSGEPSLVDFYAGESDDSIIIFLDEETILYGTVSNDSFEAVGEYTYNYEHEDGYWYQKNTTTMTGTFGSDGYVYGGLSFQENEETNYLGEVDSYNCKTNYTYEGYRLDVKRDDYIPAE